MTTDAALAAEPKPTIVPAQVVHLTGAGVGIGGRKEVKRKQLLTSFENELTATKKRFFTGSSNFFELWTRFADKFTAGDDRTGFYGKIIDIGNYLATNGDFYAASWQCFQYVLELMQLHGVTTKTQHGGDAENASKPVCCSITSIHTTEKLRKVFFEREFPDKSVIVQQKHANRRRRAANDDTAHATKPDSRLSAAAKEHARRLTELKLSAIQGYIGAEIEVLISNDARLRFPASANEALTLLKLLRCLMQLLTSAAQPPHEQQTSVQQQYFVYFHNASILTFRICRALMAAGHTREAFDYLSWAAVAFDSNPTSSMSNAAVRFLSWRTNLHYTVAKCLIALDCTNEACEFIRNWAVKCVAEAHAKEYERSGAQRTPEVRAVFRLACHRLNTIMLRQRILRLKRKGQGRQGAPAAAAATTPGGTFATGRKRFHFGRNTASASAAANDKHRSQVERILCELFEGFTAQFVALAELLDRSASVRVLETVPFLLQEDADLYGEIFEYGNFLLFGTSHGGGGGEQAHAPRARSTSRSTPPDHHLNAHEQQSPPTSMKILFDCEYGDALSDGLLAASAVGGHEMPLHSCIDFALQCFNYEQFELFEVVRKKLGEVIAANDATTEQQQQQRQPNDLIVSRMRLLLMLSVIIDNNTVYHVRKQSAGKQPAITLIAFAKHNPNLLTTDMKTQLCTALTFFIFEPQQQPQQQQAAQSSQTVPPLSQHPDAEILRDFGLLLWYQLSHSTVKLNVYDLPNHYPLEIGENLNSSKTSAVLLERRIRQLHVVWHLLVRLDYHLTEPLEMTAILYELVAAMDVFLHTVNMAHKRVNISSRFGAARLNLSTATSTLGELVQLLRHGLSIIGSARTMFKRTLTEVNLPSISIGAGGTRYRLLYNFLLDVYTELYFVHQRYVILHAWLAADSTKTAAAGETGKVTGMDAAAHGRNWKVRALYAMQAALLSHAIKTSTTPAATTVVAERLRTSISESCLPDARAMLEEAYKSLRKAKDEEDALAHDGGVEAAIVGMKDDCFNSGEFGKDDVSDVSAQNPVSPPNESNDADDALNALNESGPPPPPIAVEITDTSMTLMPAPYMPVDGVAYYKILGREFADGVKVRLKDVKLQGTNVDRRVRSNADSCCFRITGLRPNQRYIFACAAFDASGRLIWNSVGRTSRPLTAAHPLSIDYCMGVFCRVAHHVGAVNLCRLSFKSLWEKFGGFELRTSVDRTSVVAAHAGADQHARAYVPNPCEFDTVTAHAERLALQAVSDENAKDLSLIVDGVNMSPVQVRNFVVCCLLEAEVCMINSSSPLAVMGAGVVCAKVVDLLAQHHSNRIKACWRLAAAMRLAVWLNDDALATDALIECILMLTPLFHSKIYVVKEVVQIVHWCHTIITHIRRDLAATLSRMMQRICRYWPQTMITGSLNTLSAAAAAAAAAVTPTANRTSVGRPGGAGQSGRNTTTFSENTINNNARVLTERFASIIQIFAAFYYHYVTLLMALKQPAAALSVIREARVTMHLLLEQIIAVTQQNANNRDNKKTTNAPNAATAEQQQQYNNSAAAPKFAAAWQTAITEFMDEVLSELKIVPPDVASLLADRFASEQRRSNNVILPLSTAATTRGALVPARTANAVTKRDQCEGDVKQLDYAFLEVRHELDWAVLDATNTSDPEMASLMSDEFAQLLARAVHAGAGEAYEQGSFFPAMTFPNNFHAHAVSAKFRRRSRFVEAVGILCATKVNDGTICERMRNWVFDLRRYLCKRNETQLNLRQIYYGLRERLHDIYPNEFSTGLAAPAGGGGGNARNNNNDNAAITASLTDLEICKANLLPTDFKLLPSPFGLRPPVTTTKAPQTLAPPGTAGGRKKNAAQSTTNEAIAVERAMIGAAPGGGGGKEVDKIRQYAKFSRRDPSTLTDEERHQYDFARTRAGDALTLFIFERMREWKRGRQYRAVYDSERPHLMKIYFALGQASLNALVRDNAAAAAQANVGGVDLPRPSPNRFNAASPFGNSSSPPATFTGFSEDTFSMDAIFTLNACGWLIERPCDTVEVLLQKEQFGAPSPFSPVSVASSGGGGGATSGSRLVAAARRVWLAFQRAIVLGCRTENWQSVQIVLTWFWESVNIVLNLVWISTNNSSGGGATPARLTEMLHVLWKYLLVITQHVLAMHETLQQLWASHQNTSKAQQNSFSSSAPSAAAAAAVANDIWNGENWLSGCSLLHQPSLTEDRSSVNVALLMQTCLNCIELGFRQQRWVRVTELCRPTYEMFVRVTHLGDVLFPLDVAARKMTIATKQPLDNSASKAAGGGGAAGSRLLTAPPQRPTSGLKVMSENSSNLTVGVFPKASSAMSNKLMKSGGGVSPSQTAAYADAMQVGKDYRQILQQESVILRQFKYCRLLRWRAQLGIWRDKVLGTLKLSNAVTTSSTQKHHHPHPSPTGSNKPFVPAIPVIAPEFSLMQTTVNDVLYPALIFPLQRDAPFTALSKLVEMLEKYEIKQHSQFLALVYNEMGDTLLIRSNSAGGTNSVAAIEADRARAYTYYNRALECITNVKEAWHNWNEWIARREVCDAANFLFEHCGVWGCLMAAMLAYKITETSTHAAKTNVSMRYNCYTFASLCWLGTLRGNFAHPVDLIDYRNYTFGYGQPTAQLLPNLTLLNGWFSRTDSTASILLESLCVSLDEMMCHHDYLLALPLCTILRHLACDVFDSPLLLVESWLAKLEALIALQQYNDAIGVLQMLMDASYLNDCSKFVIECGGGDAATNLHRPPAAVAASTKPLQTNAEGGNFVPEQRAWFNATKRLGDVENVDALRFLVEMKFSKTVETSNVYAAEHFHRISVLQADLLVSLARSVYGLPEDVDIHGHHERLGGRFYRPIHRGAAALFVAPTAAAQSPPQLNSRSGALSPMPPASGEHRRTSAVSAGGGGKRGMSTHDAGPKQHRTGTTLSADTGVSSRSGSSSTERRSSTNNATTAAGGGGVAETDADYDLRAAIGFTDLLTAEAAPSERELKGLLLKIAYQIYSTAVEELQTATANANGPEQTNLDNGDQASRYTSKLTKKSLLRAACYRSRRGVAAVLSEFHLFDQAFAELMEVVSLLSADIDCAKANGGSSGRSSDGDAVSKAENASKHKQSSSSRSSSAMRKSATGLTANDQPVTRRSRALSTVNIDNTGRRKSMTRTASVVGEKGDAFQFTRASVVVAAAAAAAAAGRKENFPPNAAKLPQEVETTKRPAAPNEWPAGAGSATTNDVVLTNSHFFVHKHPLRGGLGLWYTNQMLLDDALMQQVVLCYGIRTPRFACAGEESSWLDETNVCLDRLIADAQSTAHVEAHAFGLLYRMRIQMLSGIDFHELAKCTDAGINLLRQLPRLAWHAQTTYAELLVLHADVQASLHAAPSYVLQTLVEAHAALCDQVESVGIHRVDCETIGYQHKCHGHSFLHTVKRKFDPQPQQPPVVATNANVGSANHRELSTAAGGGGGDAAETNVALPLVIPYTKHPKQLSNLYLTLWPLMAKAKMRIGMSFVFDIKRRLLHPNGTDHDSISTAMDRQLIESLRLLQQALKTCQDSMLQSAALEAEIAYNCGCLARILYTQFQLGSWRLCMAYLVRAIQRAYCGIHDIKLIHQCYMEMAELCYDSQETSAPQTPDFPVDPISNIEAEDRARASIQETNNEWQNLAHLAIVFASHSSVAEKSLTDILTRGDCLRDSIALSDIDTLPDVILFESIVTYDRRIVDNYMNSLMPAAEILDTLLVSSVENPHQKLNTAAAQQHREPTLSWIRLIRYIHVLRSRLNWNFVISLADVPEFDIEQASAFVAEHNKLAARATQQQTKSPENADGSAATPTTTPTAAGPVSILSSAIKPAAAGVAAAAVGTSWKVAGPEKPKTINIVAPRSGNNDSNIPETKRNAASVHESSAERNPLNIRMPAFCAFEEQEYEVLQRILISKADGYTRRATAPFPHEFIQLLNDTTQLVDKNEDERIRLLGSGHVREEQAREKSQFERILRRINSDESASCASFGCKESHEACELIMQWHCDNLQPYCHCLFTGIWPHDNEKLTQLQQRSPESASVCASLNAHRLNATNGAPISSTRLGGQSEQHATPQQDERKSDSARPSQNTSAQPYLTAIAADIPKHALAHIHTSLAAMVKQAELAVSASRVHRTEQNELKLRKALDMLVTILLQATSEIDKLLKRPAVRSFQGLHEIIEMFGPSDILFILREFNELFTPSTGGKALHPFVVAFIMSVFQDVSA